MTLKVIDGKTDGLYLLYKQDLQKIYKEICIRAEYLDKITTTAPMQANAEQISQINKTTKLISKELKNLKALI